MRSAITTNLEKLLTPEQLKNIVMAFRYLYLANPKERHFSIKFCNDDEGRGLEIWIILDEYPAGEGGLTATFLLPSDY
jgi:hypothetical protein